MSQPQKISNIINSLKLCIIIPTYNNAKTLKRVIDGVLSYTDKIIVVNDGSTDATPQILKQYSSIEVINLSSNKGKGNALKTGFNRAGELGYEFAVTIDSDGQHEPDDIEQFVYALEESANKELLLIGARNMNQSSVPKKSSFGNKFSNFWFWVETGVWLKDTQSGYRLYPLKIVNELHLSAQKFEFEIEVIVKAAWKGVEVKNIPVKVIYDKDERVSHFRPFRDFTRISILNTWLVFLTFFWIKPKKTFKKIKSKGTKNFFIEDVFGHQDSPIKKALSITLGVFIGLSPLWGFHTVVVLSLAILFKLNKTIAFAFSNVSIPPFIPFVIFAGLQTGAAILGTDNALTLDDITTSFDFTDYLKIYLIGSIVFSLIAASIVGIISYMMLTNFYMHKSKSRA